MWRLAILQTSWKRVTVDERRRQNEKFKQTVAAKSFNDICICVGKALSVNILYNN